MDPPPFWGSSSLPSIILFLCRCALNVTVWLAFSSSILSSTPPDSKVLRAGARSITLVEGKMAKEREREKPRASYHSVGTRGGNVTWLQEEEACLRYHHQLMVMWYQHLPKQNSFWHEKHACSYFTFSWLWVTKQICSQRCSNQPSPLPKSANYA